MKMVIIVYALLAKTQAIIFVNYSYEQLFIQFD